MVPDQQSQYKMLSDTSRAAHRLFSGDNVYIQIGDQLESLLLPINLTKLDPTNRLTMVSCIRLALVTAFQVEEALPDILTAKAVLNRVDWKYALDLPIEHLGITEFDLCDFRADLIASPEALDEFGLLLGNLRKIGLFSGRSEQSLVPEILIGFLNLLNQLYTLQLALFETLTVIILKAPEWLVSHIPADLYKRNSGKRFPIALVTMEELNSLANQLGCDISMLLHTLNRRKNKELSHLEEVEALRSLFNSNFYTHSGQFTLRAEIPVNCVNFKVLKEVSYRQNLDFKKSQNGAGRVI